MNLKPHLVNVEYGIVGYALDGNLSVGEEGLLLVQMINDHQIRLETFEGVYSKPETLELTEKSIVLYR